MWVFHIIFVAFWQINLALSTFPGVVNHATAENLNNASLFANLQKPNAPHVRSTVATTSVADTEAPTEKPTVAVFENDDILGCRWPQDYQQRVDFCFDHVELPKPLNSDHVLYGLLNEQLVHAYTLNCVNGSICPGQASLDDQARFLRYWADNADKLVDFRTCFQSNTEGMVRLCTPGSKVGEVVSGTTGLHLNVLNILIQLRPYLKPQNLTDKCSLKISELAHMTASFYLYEDTYQDNKFATELYCLHSACNITEDTLKQFGIWQWYFMHRTEANDRCHIKDNSDTCSATAAMQPRLYSGNETFGEKVRRKWGQVKTAVETTFNMPIHIVLAILLSVLVVFIAIVALCCMWYHGLIFTDENQRNKMRYSSLLGPRGGNPDEMRSLANEDDEYD